MAHNSAACAEHVSGETLSAWRDELLPSAEMQRVRAHIAECAACQQQLRQFEGVARALRSQREIEPGERIIEGVQLRIAQPARRGWHESHGRHGRREQVWNNLRVLLPVAAVLLLFVYVLGNGPRLPFQQQGKGGIKTATPGKTNLSGVLAVSDGSIAGQLSFAYVQNNDVWLSRFSSAPQRVTHLGVAGQQLQWGLVWSADQTRLLIEASNSSTGENVQNWILTLPDDIVTQLSAPFAGCGGPPNCHWLGDQYILYPDQSTAHSLHYRVYDTQARRNVATALDNQQETEIEARGSVLYFSPYVVSPAPLNGMIDRFDLASNSITTAFTVPGPLVLQGISNGSWDLSADAHVLVMTSAFNMTTHCPFTACHAYYQDASGAVAPIFLDQQATAQPTSEVSIAPDGRYVAEIIGSSSGTPAGVAPSQLVQQALPTRGGELTNALPAASQAGDNILGWASGSAGILIQRTFSDGSGNPTATSIYFAPTGSSAEAELVETVHVASSVVFAPPAA